MLVPGSKRQRGIQGTYVAVSTVKFPGCWLDPRAGDQGVRGRRIGAIVWGRNYWEWVCWRSAGSAGKLSEALFVTGWINRTHC
jgi:hypothetical protein